MAQARVESQCFILDSIGISTGERIENWATAQCNTYRRTDRVSLTWPVFERVAKAEFIFEAIVRWISPKISSVFADVFKSVSL